MSFTPQAGTVTNASKNEIFTAIRKCGRGLPERLGRQPRHSSGKFRVKATDGRKEDDMGIYKYMEQEITERRIADGQIAQLFKKDEEPVEGSRQQNTNARSRRKQIFINGLTLGPLGLEIDDPSIKGKTWDGHRLPRSLSQAGRLRNFLRTWKEPEIRIVKLGNVRFEDPLRVPVIQIKEEAGCLYLEIPELRKEMQRAGSINAWENEKKREAAAREVQLAKKQLMAMKDSPVIDLWELRKAMERKSRAKHWAEFLSRDQ